MDKERLEGLIFDELNRLGDRFKPVPKRFKRGFFAGDYLGKLSRGRLSSARLVTENDVRKFLKTGAVIMILPRGAIVTPLARELMEEKNIKAEHERP